MMKYVKNEKSSIIHLLIKLQKQMQKKKQNIINNSRIFFNIIDQIKF